MLCVSQIDLTLGFMEQVCTCPNHAFMSSSGFQVCQFSSTVIQSKVHRKQSHVVCIKTLHSCVLEPTHTSESETIMLGCNFSQQQALVP